MTPILIILLVLILIGLAIEDFRFRSVQIIFFPIFILITFLFGLNKIELKELITASLFNLAILTIQFAILFLFLSLKEKRAVRLFRDYLGLGDVIFLAGISFLFSTVNFCIFITGSLVMLLLFNCILGLIKKNLNKRIPLLGQLAIITIAFIILSEINGINSYDDSITGDLLFATFG
ncbi:MAG: hypothetical protein V2A54_11105 [Bacteroidota bacterium]